jgi:hypothetical protein
MLVWVPAAASRSAGGLPALAGVLAGTPWSVRRARGPGTRPALEIWAAGDLADVIVATPVPSQLLRGARRTPRGGQARSLAWGRVPADGHPLCVTFGCGLLPRQTAACVIEVEGLAWFAITGGRFSAVSVTCRGVRERLRLRTA